MPETPEAHTTDQNKAGRSGTDSSTTELGVQSMTCASCVSRIERALGKCCTQASTSPPNAPQ